MDPASIALVLHLITPCRWLDTRVPGCIVGAGRLCAQGPMTDGEVRKYLVQASAVCPADGLDRPVPLGAQALQVSVTVIGATSSGHLLLYDPTLAERPLASTINFDGSGVRSNWGIVALGQWQGQAPGIPILPDVGIYARVASGSVHVVVDIVGYWMPEAP